MRRVLIIGGGFAGVSAAAHLAHQQWAHPIEIIIVNSKDPIGPGVAYGTEAPFHLLNVPAGRMGALVGDEAQFLRWAQGRDPAVTGDAFLPRRLYGEYLVWLAAEMARTSHPGADVRFVLDVATDVEVFDDFAAVNLSRHGRLRADRVVLATGNEPPRELPGVPAGERDDVCYIRDPWKPGVLDFRVTGPVMMVGTGLTMVDVAMTLRANGHRGALVAISRHGLLPQAHRNQTRKPSIPGPPEELRHWDGSASALLHIVREAVVRTESDGGDWRDVINALRPVTPMLWQRIPERHRGAFLRHVRPYWETHRHRMPIATAETIHAMISAGELDLHASHIVSLELRGDHAVVTTAARGGGESVLIADRVINCTGPETRIAHSRNRILMRAMQRGLLVPDAHGLGVMTDADGALIAHDGTISRILFTLGALRRATLWESTAVPEIRQQADHLARHLQAAQS